MQRILLAAAIAFAAQTQADAAPFDFTFTMPAFEGGDFFGLSSTLTVTADNGGTDTLSQSWLNTDILGYSVTVGALSLALNTSDDPSLIEGSQTYITTDAAGVPTLDLTAVLDTRAAIGIFGVNAIQLGTRDGLGPTQYIVAIGGQSGFVTTPFVAGPAQVAVPLPASALLLLGGLGALAACARKRPPAGLAFAADGAPGCGSLGRA